MVERLQNKPQYLSVKADSREEAVAFTCAVLTQNGMTDSSACIYSESGWRFCEKNPNIAIGVATTPEVAVLAPSSKNGFTVIVPLSLGDNETNISSGLKSAEGNIVTLPRIESRKFEETLISLGEEKADAARLARSTGRSWSVYRRIRSRNAAISKPNWLNDPDIKNLMLVSLVGCWNGNQAGDNAFIEAVSGQEYTEIEASLIRLSQIDDSPILQIGAVWKAKAPFELIFQLGPILPPQLINQFFSVVESVLATPDPSLELEEKDRWAANIYGKVRKQSGLVIDSVADSLSKLAFYAEMQQDGQSYLLLNSITTLVEKLLGDASSERWLSLNSILRELAEAAPHEFLQAVEDSLSRVDRPIASLFSESKSAMFGRCTHADLLWALEVLGWSERWLPRVSKVLIQLVDIKVPGNWGNTPLNTLISFFRPWFTQTSAEYEFRKKVIDQLISTSPRQAWELILALMPKVIGGMATLNATPRWRDYDSGFTSEVLMSEIYQSITHICGQALKLAEGNPERIASLLDRDEGFNEEQLQRLIELIKSSEDFDDEGKEIVRKQLREFLSWQNSFNTNGEKQDRHLADTLYPWFDKLAPDNLAIRHSWLFENEWTSLPEGREDDYEGRAERYRQLRSDALDEIFEDSGWVGIEELVELCGNHWIAGREISNKFKHQLYFPEWLVRIWLSRSAPYQDSLITSALAHLSDDEASMFFDAALKIVPEAKTGADSWAALVSNFPFDKNTWLRLEKLPEDTISRYWEKICPRGAKAEESVFVLSRLISKNRHRVAFSIIQYDFKHTNPEILFEILNGIKSGSDPNGPLPSGWSISEAIDYMSKSGKIPRRQLALLEFAYFDAINTGERSATHLYSEMLDDPALFMECICLVFKKRSQKDEIDVNLNLQELASTGWSVLHDGRGVPSLTEDKTVDSEKFDSWVQEVRNIAIQQDRVEVTDSTIGQWFSSCPPDEDGNWPCTPVIDTLDQRYADKIRSGFSIGIHNNRGVTTRAWGEGGGQERELAKKYDDLAEKFLISHSNESSMFKEIANGYRREAIYHDNSSNLDREL